MSARWRRGTKLRVRLPTLGCKVNQYDTATMETALRDGLRDRAVRRGRRRLRGELLHGHRPRRRGEPAARAPGAAASIRTARVILTGCFAQTSPQRAALPEVDYVIGVGRLPDMLRAVHDQIRPRKAAILVRQPAQGRAGERRSAPRCSAGRRAPSSRCRRAATCSARSASCRSRAAAAAASSRARVLERAGTAGGARLSRGGADRHPSRRLRQGSARRARARRPGGDDRRGRAGAAHPPELDRSARGDAAAARSDGAQRRAVPASARAGAGRRRRRAAPHAAALRQRLVRDVAAEIVACLPDAALGTDVIAGFPGESDAEFAARLRAAGGRAVHVLPRLPVLAPQRHHGGQGARPPFRAADDRGAGTTALRRSGPRKRRAFAERFVGHVGVVLVESSARPRERAAGRLQPQLPARAGSGGADAWVNTR